MRRGIGDRHRGRDSGFEEAPDRPVPPALPDLAEEPAEEQADIMANTPPPPAVPPPQAQVSAGQLNAVDKYDGESDVTPFLRRISQHITQFGWSEQQTASIVQNRLVGKAQTWLESRLVLGHVFAGNDAWTANDGLRSALLERFGPRETVASSSKELATLSIRSSELPRDFLDRVKVAIGRADERVTPEAQRATPEHREYVARDIYKWFSRGIVGTPWYTKLFENSGVDPAPDLAALEHQVANLQTQHEAQTRKGTSAGSLHELQTTEDSLEVFSLDADAPLHLQIAELRQVFQRHLRGGGSGGAGGGGGRGGRGRGRRGRRNQPQPGTSGGASGKSSRADHVCETCGGKGHYGSECASSRPYEPKPRSGPSQSSGWRQDGAVQRQTGRFPPRRQQHGSVDEATEGPLAEHEGFPALPYLPPQDPGNADGGR